MRPPTASATPSRSQEPPTPPVKPRPTTGTEQVPISPHPAVKLLNGTTPTAATTLYRDGLSSVRAIIAATVAGIPDSLGGKRMAIRVAELARAGLTPDWMPGAVPRCVPSIVKQNQHGTHAGAIVVGTERS